MFRFALGASMLGYGAWTDHKTRRVPNQTWLISGTIASILLAYELTTDDSPLHVSVSYTHLTLPTIYSV